jgi:hypothetical protein
VYQTPVFAPVSLNVTTWDVVNDPPEGAMVGVVDVVVWHWAAVTFPDWEGSLL